MDFNKTYLQKPAVTNNLDYNYLPMAGCRLYMTFGGHAKLVVDGANIAEAVDTALSFIYEETQFCIGRMRRTVYGETIIEEFLSNGCKIETKGDGNEILRCIGRTRVLQ